MASGDLLISTEPEELRLVLVGGSGSGKSATGNAILGKRAFTTRQSQDTETLTCQTERGEFEGTPVVVVDTPSTFPINVIEMFKFIYCCASCPHVFLLMISSNQFTDVERYVTSLQWWFGEEVLCYTLILFTGGDGRADGLTTTEQLIRENPVPYGVGYHVFNNRDEDPSQVRELLRKISTMVQRNGGSYHIKVKDWNYKYLFPFASAVTLAGGIGAASGATPGGALVALLGSLVGAVAAVGGNRAVAVVIATAGAAAVAIGDGVGTSVAGKATAAIVAGAGVHGAVCKVFDDIDVRVGAIFGIIGGVGVGSGVPVAVGGYTKSGGDFVSGALLAYAGVTMVFIALFDNVRNAGCVINKIVVFAVVAGVSVGAAFGAAVGVLSASGFPAGVIIIIAFQAVTWWLNRKG